MKSEQETTRLPLLADCKNEDIDYVYKRDIYRMEQIIICHAGMMPFLREDGQDSQAGDVPGFYFFEMYSNRRWRPRH